MAEDISSEPLHIPRHIRFECTGCGNCCLQWPVPLTQEDVDRISSLLPEELSTMAAPSEFERKLHAFMGKPTGPGFRALDPGDLRFRGFSHTLEKRTDGRCRFLSEENRCRLHEEHGSDAKPSMCRLFPYAFSKTPSGAFAYVSFASSGVLFNSGRLLSEQGELMSAKYRLYQQLFPRVESDWSKLQLLDGQPLLWDRYLLVEQRFLEILEDDSDTGVLGKLLLCSERVLELLAPGANPEQAPPLESPPEKVDQILLKHLSRLYLPDDVFHDPSFDLDARALAAEIVQAPQVVSLADARFTRLAGATLGKLPADCEDLLFRFVFARVFAKLYLGPNLAHLSLLSGIHHLLSLIAIVRLELKRLKLQGQECDLTTVAEIVRKMERRLCQMNFSPSSSAILEVLLASPSRAKRVYDLAQ